MPNSTLIKQSLTVSRDELAEALLMALQAVSNSPSRPMLGNVLFSADKGLMTITSFDEQNAIIQKIEEVTSDFPATVVPARLFSDTVSKQPKGCELKIELDGNTLLIKRGRSKVTLPAQAGEDYPSIESATGESFFINTDTFTKALSKLLFSVSADKSKPILTGVNLKGNKAASTDGHRLSVVNIDTEIESSITLPSRTLNVVSKMASAAVSPEIKMTQGDGFVTFKIGGTTEVYSRVIDGSYPNYLQLIPAKFAHEVDLNRTGLIQCLERVLVIADLCKDVITLTFDDGLAVTANALEAGSIEEFMDCDSQLKFEISFNGRYLMEALKVMNSDVISLKMNGATTPVVINDDEGYTHLIMPIQKRN